MTGREGLNGMSDHRRAVNRWWRTKPGALPAQRTPRPAPFVVGLRRTSPAWSTRLDEVLEFNASR
ncbi:hypothetical protein QRX50_38975 [Amycolatopsis carbonis]|uniref:Uncharacterized protein n=1 Tax=Amycolatopsis carbonis TaxID=715471 RepID=A0A9Y2IE39_9PSEU|nr:hypothetical protein [Amycolatopsis sp. 2-15]WIX77331.1 hypothetical protein QRX50_38975 [Amycolatopsis sp. 2-15]